VPEDHWGPASTHVRGGTGYAREGEHLLDPGRQRRSAARLEAGGVPHPRPCGDLVRDAARRAALAVDEGYSDYSPSSPAACPTAARSTHIAAQYDHCAGHKSRGRSTTSRGAQRPRGQPAQHRCSGPSTPLRSCQETWAPRAACAPTRDYACCGRRLGHPRPVRRGQLQRLGDGSQLRGSRRDTRPRNDIRLPRQAE
jgi:hypothetical protein